jgi:hypothetical protein
LEKLKGIDHLEDLEVDGKILLERILGKYDGVDWIHLAEDRDQWRILKNTVMNLRVP